MSTLFDPLLTELAAVETTLQDRARARAAKEEERRTAHEEAVAGLQAQISSANTVASGIADERRVEASSQNEARAALEQEAKLQQKLDAKLANLSHTLSEIQAAADARAHLASTSVIDFFCRSVFDPDKDTWGTSFVSTPTSAVDHILSFLQPPDIELCSHTCRKWSAAVCSGGSWKRSQQQQQQLLHALHQSAAAADTGPERHEHYFLQIKLVKDSYVVSVVAEEVINYECDEKVKGGRKPTEEPERLKKGIALAVCSRHCLGATAEVQFCEGMIQAHGGHTQAKLDSAAFRSQLDQDDGLKKALTRTIKQTEATIRSRQQEIDNIVLQFQSDNCTKDFLLQNQADLKKRVAESRADTEQRRSQAAADLVQKEQELQQRAVEQQATATIFQQLKQHKLMLAKEVKNLRVQLEEAKKSRAVSEGNFNSFKAKLDALRK